jgi:hypothetical protein
MRFEIVRQGFVIHVRTDRKIEDSQRPVATDGRPPEDEVLPDAGRHHDAPNVTNYTTSPGGENTVRGNDNPNECDPTYLC